MKKKIEFLIMKKSPHLFSPHKKTPFISLKLILLKSLSLSLSLKSYSPKTTTTTKNRVKINLKQLTLNARNFRNKSSISTNLSLFISQSRKRSISNDLFRVESRRVITISTTSIDRIFH